MSQDAKIAYLEQLLDRAHDAGPEPEIGSDPEDSVEALEDPIESPAAPRRRYPASPSLIAAPPRDAESRYRDTRGPLLYFALLALIPLISVALWLFAPPRAAFEEPVPEEWASRTDRAPAPTASAPAASPLAQAPAALRVTSDPEGPFVYIDGVLAGISPYLTDTLTAGWRVVSLEMAGYVSRDTLLYVAPATATTVALTLDSLANASPPVVESESSTTESELPPAVAPERVLPSDAPAVETIETTPEPVVESPPQPAATETPDEPAPVTVTGTLSVLVRPWGSIYVDDVRKAQDTDLRWTADVPVGLRTVRVVHPVLGVQQHTVEVQADETTSLVIDLY